MKFDMSSVRKWMLVAAGSAALLGATNSWAADEAARKDIAQTGDATCTRCHDEGELKPVLSIAKTRHGTMADPKAGTCTSCHGESPTHINKPEGVEQRPAPDVNYGKKSETAISDRNQSCLNCHSGGQRMHWETGPHAAANLECTSCHKIHQQTDPIRERATQAEACFSCHKEQRAQVMRPNHHPIPEGKVICSDCHNPHGSAGPKLMQRDSVVATCYTCHMEKRGPFIRSHQPVTEDCTICHTPHGSVNDNLLKQRAPFLCNQCHENQTHQGLVPNPEGTLAPGFGSFATKAALGRGCLNCHTQIHGTNNPFDDTSSGRALRR